MPTPSEILDKIRMARAAQKQTDFRSDPERIQAEHDWLLWAVEYLLTAVSAEISDR
jgi:hypothetical protein